MKINRLMFPAFFAALLAACNPLPHQPVTPDEAPALACPCPDFAHPWHPGALTNDPDHPGECMTRSRTGQWMDARQHRACQAEARERGEQTP